MTEYREWMTEHGVTSIKHGDPHIIEDPVIPPEPVVTWQITTREGWLMSRHILHASVEQIPDELLVPQLLESFAEELREARAAAPPAGPGATYDRAAKRWVEWDQADAE